MSDREAFLKALTENEDDLTTRLVYSDWLEEQGEHEEAERQRQWPAAKKWLVQFCEKHNPEPDEEDPYEWIITYQELLDLGREAVRDLLGHHDEKSLEDGGSDDWWLGFSCGNNMGMCEALRANGLEFWKNWSIVTGIPLPRGTEDSWHFSCAC